MTLNSKTLLQCDKIMLTQSFTINYEIYDYTSFVVYDCSVKPILRHGVILILQCFVIDHEIYNSTIFQIMGPKRSNKRSGE